MATNLPPKPLNDSAAGTRLFYDTYGETPLQFNASDVETTIGFFTDLGFALESAKITAMSILKQAKFDGTPVNSILDRIKSFNTTQVSALVSEILNNNRVPTSILGYASEKSNDFKTRNIAP